MEKNTAAKRGLIALLGIASQAFAQHATVSLGSGSVGPDGNARVDISLATSGGVAPAGLQWTMTFPTSAIAKVSVVTGTGASAAGKTVTCNNNAGRTICIVVGLNRLILSDGVLAIANFTINAGAAETVPPVWITDVVVTDMNGNVIPSSLPSGPVSIGSIGSTGNRSPLKASPAHKAELGTQQSLGFTLANVATGLAGDACSPGGLAAILGSSIQGAAQGATTFPLPTRLAGVQVKVNDVATPLLFASDSQINFQCPLLDVGTPLKMTIEGEHGVLGLPIVSTMQAATPGLFMLNDASQGVVLIGSTNEIAISATEGIPSRPARPTEPLTIYASGLGEAMERVSPGEAAPSNRLILLKNKVRVQVGAVEIEPEIAALAQGAAGLYQLNLLLPAAAPVGDAVPVYLKVTASDGTLIQSNVVHISIQEAEKNSGANRTY